MRFAMLTSAGSVLVVTLLIGYGEIAAQPATAPRPAAAGTDASPVSTGATESLVDPTDFVGTIDNRYFPLKPGTTFVYEGKKEGQDQRDEVTVTGETKTILGVPCVVVRDRVMVDGQLAEDTLDWYAQDTAGNVWYFGEAAKSYEPGAAVSTEGSWEAGIDGAKPGIVMPAQPAVGHPYQQEYSPGVAEDMAQALSLTETVSVPSGSFHDVLRTKEWSPLEPSVVEHKSYAPGVGLVLAVSVQGEAERLELVEVTSTGGEAGGTPIAAVTRRVW